ncbi:MAG: hypothetical protein OEZ23_00815 [Gammaproteobacteria bacterium]|nr:hypothetical protein [Gammaproteobacteria bacterium]
MTRNAIFYTIVGIIMMLNTAVHAQQASPNSGRTMSSYCDHPESWSDDQKQLLRERCDRMAESAKEHQHRQEMADAWIKDHGKSEAMRNVFSGFGNIIPEESMSEGTARWTYKTGNGECVTYEFNSTGEVLGNKVGECGL